MPIATTDNGNGNGRHSHCALSHEACADLVAQLPARIESVQRLAEQGAEESAHTRSLVEHVSDELMRMRQELSRLAVAVHDHGVESSARWLRVLEHLEALDSRDTLHDARLDRTSQRVQQLTAAQWARANARPIGVGAGATVGLGSAISLAWWVAEHVVPLLADVLAR